MTPFPALTSAQQDILRLVAQGYDDASIAERQGCEVAQVERLLAEIYRQLGVEEHGELDPRVEAARMFMAADGVPGRE